MKHLSRVPCCRSFGVLLFELSTGADLFPKALNRDVIVTEASRQALGNWTTLGQDQLDLVFKPAARLEQAVSVVRRLVTQDLIMLCLCGNSGSYGGGHPCPSDRPASMDEVLRHPFFWSDKRLESEIILPEVTLRTGTDVMLSYRTTEVFATSALPRD